MFTSAYRSVIMLSYIASYIVVKHSNVIILPFRDTTTYRTQITADEERGLVPAARMRTKYDRMSYVHNYVGAPYCYVDPFIERSLLKNRSISRQNRAIGAQNRVTS